MLFQSRMDTVRNKPIQNTEKLQAALIALRFAIPYLGKNYEVRKWQGLQSQTFNGELRPIASV
jgi:hypothetical protein